MELRVDLHPRLEETVIAFLIELGSPGVVQEKVPGLPSRSRKRIRAYFPADRTFGEKRRRIRNFFRSRKDSLPIHFRSRLLRERNWAETWKANFHPLRISSRITVKPPWEEYRPAVGEEVIEINPGLAFGTGTHPSTQMCLQVLEELIPAFPRPPTVLDVGTGSGILAIAARKLGAGKIRAIDIDPQALACARENLVLNRMAGGIELRLDRPGRLCGRFDIVLANMLPQELLGEASSLGERVPPGGILVVSGLRWDQKTEVRRAFARQGLKVRRSRSLQGWVCLVLGRGDEP